MTDTPVDQTDADRNWEALRAKAEKADQLEAQLANLARKDAFRDVGLDPSKPLHAAVIKSFDGPLEADKIREYVASTGLLAPPATPPEQQAQVDTARETQGRIGEASEGAQVTTPDTFVSDVEDLDRRARAEGWKIDQYNAEMVRISQKHGLPTMFDGV